MYLKELEINHFKSFADFHRIPFHGKLIIITGPNGSGKSNILDAVRWVLGEQRIKLLRAERSEEIIFGGNKFLSPSKYAQVDITLSLPQEDNISQEIVITRKIIREGESEYFLNDNPIRLKDLQLFLSSFGLGKHNFLFIGQGELESLILNDGENLKNFIEDVAGISGYQYKVKETQIRLEVIESKWRELEERKLSLLKELEVLRKEAEIADYYERLSKELEDIKESLLYYQWQRIKKNIEEYDKKIFEKENYLKSLEEKFYSLEEELLVLKEKKERLSNSVREISKKLSEYRTLISEGKAKIEVITQRIFDKTKAKENIEKEIKENEEELLNITKDLGESQLIFEEEKEKDISHLERELKELEKFFKERELEKIRLEERIKTFFNLNFTNKNLEEENRSLNRLIDLLSTSLENLNRRKRNLEEFSIKISREIREKDTLIGSKERYLEELKFEIQKERRFLRDLEELQEESYPKGVREIVSLKDREVLGLVVDILEVQKDYLTPIYNILGNSLFDIIVKDEYTAERLIKYLREKNLGWATFRPLSFYKEYKVREINIKKALLAINVVSFDQEYKNLVYNLLGNVLIFEDFETAVKEKELLKEGWRFVTLRGEVFLGSGTISGGVRANVQTALNINKTKREKEEKLSELNQSIDFIIKDLEELRKERRKLFLKKDKVERILRKIRERIENIEKRIGELNSKREQIELFLREGESILKRIEILDEELETLEKEIEFKRKNYEELKGDYVFNKKKVEFLRERKRALEMKIQNLNEERIKLEKDIENLKKELINLEENKEVYIKEDENLEKELDIREKELRDIEEKEEILKREWHNIKEKILVEKTLIEEITKRREDMGKEISERFDKVPSLKKDLPEGKLKQREKEIQKEIEELGPINFLAKDKLSIEEKKYFELSQQVEDVYSSVSSLREIIRKTRKEAEMRFLATYERLKEMANNNWKLFFPHGELNLILENSNDPLESKVFLKLSSNRKNFKTLLMLSGGEKSITSLSLLLAGIQIAPVNFCFWDEIDSALDSHNAEILGKKLKELSKDIQFIIISHNPIIMEFGDVLYGVVLNEKGYSQVISYSLEGDEVLR